MSKWSEVGTGAVWGGAIGSFLGPGGTVVGALVGSWFGGRNSRAQDDAIQELLVKTIALNCAASHADGKVVAKEQKVISELAESLAEQMDPDYDEDQIEGLVEQLISNPPSHSEAAVIFASFPVELQPVVFRNVLSVLAADGEVAESEVEWLASMVAQSQADPDIWRMNLMFYRREGRVPKSSRAHAAEILHVTPDASKEELKRSWRKQASDYHPDRLMQVSEPVRKLAEEKLREVNEAYEVLSRDSSVPHEDLWMFAAADSTLQSGESVKKGQVVECFLCDAKNRLPAKEKVSESRCGKCRALLAFPEELAALWEEK